MCVTPDIVATTRCFNLLTINLFTLIHMCTRLVRHLFGRSLELRTGTKSKVYAILIRVHGGAFTTQRREQGGVSHEYSHTCASTSSA